jgi:cellulose synthase operon protein C
VQLGLNASTSNQSTHAPTGTSTEPTHIATVTLLTPNVIGLELRLYDSYASKASSRFARLTPDTESRTFRVHEALREDLVWMLTFGVKPNQPMPTTQEDCRKAMEVGSKKIEAYLSNLSANRVQNLRFVQRRRPREHAATAADALDDRIAALGARNGSQNAKAIDCLLKERDELLRRPRFVDAVRALDRAGKRTASRNRVPAWPADRRAKKCAWRT